MARELSIIITADGAEETQAKLAKVEDRIEGVEQAAGKTSDAMDDLSQAQDKATQSGGRLAQVFARMGGPTGVATAAGTAMLFATKYAIDLTGNIDKLAKRAEVSIDAMQGLDAVAKRNGSSFESLSKAMFDLDAKLAKGGKNIEATVSGMGLAVDDLLGLSRDERFRALATAIVSIEDPAERARVAVELFGGQAQDLMPILRDVANGVDQTMPRISSRFVEAGAEMSQAWSSTLDTVTTRGQQFLTYLTLWPAALSSWAQDVSAAIWGAVGNLPTLPGQPNMGLPVGMPGFDPLGGQSMGFVERQLTQGAQAQIRAREQAARAAGRAAGRVIPFAPRPLDFGPGTFNGGGFGMFRPGVMPNLPFPTLESSMTLPWAGFAPTVMPNAPGAAGGGFGSWLRGSGGRIAGMGLGMLSGLIPGMSGMGSSIGSVAGSAIGSIGKIAGTALGPLLGPLGGLVGGLVGKLFGPSEGTKTNRTRDSWISENFGSVEALREAAEKAGFSVDRMLSVKKVKDFQAEVDKLNAAMQQSEADAIRTEEAMARWGLTIQDMGPKFQQSKINDAFKEATEDLRVLTEASADFEMVAEKMAPHFGGLIQEAIEMGGTVPRELEPILKKMIEMGILVDKNGDKFTDLSQIPFAADLNKDFQTLISKMDALIERIGDMTSGFREAADAASEVADNAPGGGGGGPQSDTGFAHGGVVGRDWRRRSMRDTIPAWLRPGEMVITPEQRRAGGGGGGVSVSIGNLSVGAGASRAQTAETVGEAVVAYMERRGVRFGRRVA